MTQCASFSCLAWSADNRLTRHCQEDVKLVKLYSAREKALKREAEEHGLLEEVFAQRRELCVCVSRSRLGSFSHSPCPADDRHPALRRRLDGQRRAAHADPEAQLAQMTDGASLVQPPLSCRTTHAIPCAESERIIVRGNFYNRQAAELQSAFKRRSQRDKGTQESFEHTNPALCTCH